MDHIRSAVNRVRFGEIRLSSRTASSSQSRDVKSNAFAKRFFFSHFHPADTPAADRNHRRRSSIRWNLPCRLHNKQASKLSSLPFSPSRSRNPLPTAAQFSKPGVSTVASAVFFPCSLTLASGTSPKGKLTLEFKRPQVVRLFQLLNESRIQKLVIASGSDGSTGDSRLLDALPAQ